MSKLLLRTSTTGMCLVYRGFQLPAGGGESALGGDRHPFPVAWTVTLVALRSSRADPTRTAPSARLGGGVHRILPSFCLGQPAGPDG
jgi:hypothetical protein